MMNEDLIERAIRLRRMMNERIEQEPPWQRDRRMQADLACAQTAAQRFEALGILMNQAIARRAASLRDHHG
ncbi:MAG: hypothetical protein ACE5EC_10275 [Phycisphaerae bacterium]